MIEQVDERLANWATAILGEGIVSFEAPDNSRDEAVVTVNFYLLDLVDSPPLRGGTGRPPIQFSLRYLVTTSIANPWESHRLLDRLIFAAMETPDFEVEFQSVLASIWTALGTTPRPYFSLRIPVRQERPEPSAPPVHRLEVEVASITSLQGVVLAPDNIPLAGARVELESLQLATQTNSRGQFRFPGIPLEPATKQLHITARGKQFDVIVQQPRSQNETVEVHLDLLKGNEESS